MEEIDYIERRIKEVESDLEILREFESNDSDSIVPTRMVESGENELAILESILNVLTIDALNPKS